MVPVSLTTPWEPIRSGVEEEHGSVKGYPTQSLGIASHERRFDVVWGAGIQMQWQKGQL